MEKMYLNLQFENFLCDLYGKMNYHGTVGWTGFSLYKKNLFKISKSIRSAIDLNIQGIDADHCYSLMSKLDLLEKDIKASKSFEELGQFVSLRLFQLVFLLLGDIPNNWNLEKKTHKSHFSLKKHRGIYFTQSLEQKFNSIIINAPSNQDSDIEYSRQMLLNLFTTLHNRDHKRFLDWHKETFPEIYLKII